MSDRLTKIQFFFKLKLLIFRGGEWFFKNSGSRKILVEFHGSRSLVFLAVMFVSQSRFLYEGVSESRFFARLRASKSRFVCLFVCLFVLK